MPKLDVRHMVIDHSTSSIVCPQCKGSLKLATKPTAVEKLKLWLLNDVTKAIKYKCIDCSVRYNLT